MERKKRQAKELDPETIARIKQLGERITQLRKRNYSSHETFAYDFDFSRSQYYRYEKGEDIQFSTLVRLLKAFDITLIDFFSEGFDGK
ncbi:MAG: helix-turn-helix domain-containing protein [Cytophagales bacterium]|nr:helix-turn-helix domain-containing protein [Cytophagales bacterium]